jgi:dephospho-CoA kinase
MTHEPVVVISGQVAAGKTTAAKMLEKRGFQYARIAKAIKKLRWPSGREDKPPRSWYQQMGHERI